VGVPCRLRPEAAAFSDGSNQTKIKNMNYLLIRHRVKEYKKWKAGYDQHNSARKAAGLKERFLLRSTRSHNDVLILFEAADLARAKAFCGSADLRAAMKKAGVTGKPDLSVFSDS
jgi:hypothetical protein